MSSEKELQPPPGYPPGGKENEEEKKEEKFKDEEGEEDETKIRCIGARMGGGYNMISTGYGYGSMGGRARPPGRYPGPFDNYDEPPRVPYYGGAPNYGYGGDGGGRGRGRYCAQVQVEYEGGRAIYPNNDGAEFEGELDYKEGYGPSPNIYKGHNNKMSQEYYQQQSQYVNEGYGHHGPPPPCKRPVYAPEVVFYRRRGYKEY